jgi:hypothetical protein
MTEPPLWTSEQLEIDRVKAIELFRKERMEEPLEDYLDAFDKYQGHIEELLETTLDLAQLSRPGPSLAVNLHLRIKVALAENSCLALAMSRGRQRRPEDAGQAGDAKSDQCGA